MRNLITDVPLSGAVPLPDIPGFSVVGHTQTFYGYCDDCRSTQQEPL